MVTITKKELIDRIAAITDSPRVQVKKVVQQFLDEVIQELGKGNRLEFRDFGVFETKVRRRRKAQNPKTLQPVDVPEKRTVKFKVGRLMKEKLGLPADENGGNTDEGGADDVGLSAEQHGRPLAHDRAPSDGHSRAAAQTHPHPSNG